jgi:hypothetical protein
MKEDPTVSLLSSLIEEHEELAKEIVKAKEELIRQQSSYCSYAVTSPEM